MLELLDNFVDRRFDLLIDDNDQLTQIFTQLDRLGVSAQYWLEEWTTEG